MPRARGKLFSQGFVQTPKFSFSQQEEERKKKSRHKSLRSRRWLARVGRGPGPGAVRWQ